MEFTSRFIFVVNFVPLIESSVDAEGFKLNLKLTDFLVRLYDIFVHHKNSQSIVPTLNVDVEGLIPFGLLVCITLVNSLELLISYLDDAIGIHLKRVGNAGE